MEELQSWLVRMRVAERVVVGRAVERVGVGRGVKRVMVGRVMVGEVVAGGVRVGGVVAGVVIAVEESAHGVGQCLVYSVLLVLLLKQVILRL